MSFSGVILAFILAACSSALPSNPMGNNEKDLVSTNFYKFYEQKTPASRASRPKVPESKRRSVPIPIAGTSGLSYSKERDITEALLREKYQETVLVKGEAMEKGKVADTIKSNGRPLPKPDFSALSLLLAEDSEVIEQVPKHLR